jgi:GTP-binding protein
VRAFGTDEKAQLPPPLQFSLEEMLEYIQEDELVEVTPKSMRIREIYLDENERKRRKNNAL